MGKRNAVGNNNNNSSNVLSQQKILEDLNQMTKNDVKAQFNNNKGNGKKNTKKNRQNQQQQQQQPQQQQPQQQVQQPQQKQQQAKQQQPKSKKLQKQQPQPQQPPKPVKPDTSVRGTSKLMSSWNYYTNTEWKSTPANTVKNITQFANRGDIKAQLDQVQEIQIKYSYKPERKQKSETKKLNKRKLRAAAKFPPDMHSYRRKQLLQELNDRNQQKATHERVTNLLVKRYTQKMNAFAEEYQKAYKTYQESIKENLGVEEIKNSKIQAHKMSSQQRRLQKKAKLQKKQFKKMRQRILESHASPAQWTPNHQKVFQAATQKILGQSYEGFHYFGRPEYNRDLAWVDANENSTTKDSISVASIMACQNSPIPEEGTRRLERNRVPTVPPTLEKRSLVDGGNSSQKPKSRPQPKQKPMTIKMQTPEQYRERLSGGKKSKKSPSQKKFNTDNGNGNNSNGNNGNGRNKSSTPRKMESSSPESPSIVSPGPATWVEETEFPDNFAWGILQHQANGNGTNRGRNNKRRTGGKKNKDETLNLLFPNSAPNTNGGAKKSQRQNNGGNGGKKQNRKQQGINISEML